MTFLKQNEKQVDNFKRSVSFICSSFLLSGFLDPKKKDPVMKNAVDLL